MLTSPHEPSAVRFAICRNGPSEAPGYMGEINPVGEISVETADEFRSAMGHVRTHMQFDLLQMTYLNLMGHRSLHDEMRRRAARRTSITGSRSTEIAQMIMASLFNFCSSVHALQDHSEAKAIRRGGSELKDEVHAVFADAYGRSDELFFIRKLRDVLVHSQLQVFDYDWSNVQPAAGEPAVAGAETYFRRGALVTQGAFNARLKGWLNARDERFEVFPVLDKAFRQLHPLQAEVIRLTDPDLAAQAHTVTSVWNEITSTLDDCTDLVLFPATADFEPDLERSDLMVVFEEEVISYARALLEEEPPDGSIRVV